MKHTYDVIVLGLGAMGSATLYQLSKRGAHALGIDQYGPPHTHGSSHGETRITRQAIGEGAFYTPFALRSNEIWREIEAETAEPLMTANGCLILWDPDKASSLHNKPGFLDAAVESAKQYGIAHDVLEAPEIRRRFPQFRLAGNEAAYYEPGGGFLRPEACVRTQLRLAADRGAVLRTHETVSGYEASEHGVVVMTGSGQYEAGCLIVCAGAWIGRFVPERLQCLFKVYPQILYWFDISSAYELYAPERFPVFIWALGADVDGDIYGFPAVAGAQGGIKIATEQYRVESQVTQYEPEADQEQIEHMYRHLASPHLAGVGPRCLRSQRCLYTVTPDSHFVIDRHPDHSNVIIASPCSGHGFKHSAAVGEALAELALEGAMHLDIRAFSLARFA